MLHNLGHESPLHQQLCSTSLEMSQYEEMLPMKNTFTSQIKEYHDLKDLKKLLWIGYDGTTNLNYHIEIMYTILKF